MSDIVVRPGVREDAAYILATWLNHFKNHSYFALRIKRGNYFPFQHKIVEGILKRPTTEVFIAHPAGEPEIIFAFLVVERQPQLAKPILHFAFVKEELRHMGLCRRMMDEARATPDAFFTHWTFTMNDLVKKYPSLEYVPYLV